MLSPSLYWMILFLVTAYAFGRGRLDERAAAIICVVATVASVSLNGASVARYDSIESGLLVIDALALLGFVAIALRSERFWPLWVAGLQLTTILSHFLKLMGNDLVPRAYAAAERFWVYPIFVIIVVGTWRSSQRRLARRDSDLLPG